MTVNGSTKPTLIYTNQYGTCYGIDWSPDADHIVVAIGPANGVTTPMQGVYTMTDSGSKVIQLLSTASSNEIIEGLDWEIQ